MSERAADIKRRCLSRILQPIIQFCVTNDLTLSDIVEASKQNFVTAAQRELEANGERVTASRVTVMTGVHRKDVRRIWEAPDDRNTKPSFTVRILGRWLSDSDYLTKSGKPRVLSSDGENSDFWGLVRSVSRELNPATLLYEFERKGLIKHTRGGVKLIREYEPLGADSEADFAHLGRDVSELLTAVQENLTREEEIPNLHLRTDFDNIFIDDIPKIRNWLLEQGSIFHRKVRTYLAQYDGDVHPEKNKVGGGQVTVGAFSRVSVEQENPDTP